VLVVLWAVHHIDHGVTGTHGGLLVAGARPQHYANCDGEHSDNGEQRPRFVAADEAEHDIDDMRTVDLLSGNPQRNDSEAV
jgi:hypothetical protein